MAQLAAGRGKSPVCERHRLFCSITRVKLMWCASCFIPCVGVQGPLQTIKATCGWGRRNGQSGSDFGRPVIPLRAFIPVIANSWTLQTIRSELRLKANWVGSSAVMNLQEGRTEPWLAMVRSRALVNSAPWQAYVHEVMGSESALRQAGTRQGPIAGQG